MSALAQPPVTGEVVLQEGDVILGAQVLDHLEVQLESARRLLAIVLDQGVAIRARNVQEVVACAGTMQAELQRRALLERTRTGLLAAAGVRLGVDPGAVTVGLLGTILDPADAATAATRSAELRGILAEVQQEHHTNRALMQQELSFLNHLLRLADPGRATGYDAMGDHARQPGARLSTRHRVLDLEV